MSIRQTRLQGYTWTPQQEKDYEDLYQSWGASDMAAEIVNRSILYESLESRHRALVEAAELALDSMIWAMDTVIAPHGQFQQRRDALRKALQENNKGDSG